MIDKQPRKTTNFSSQDEDYIRQLAGDIGCHYHKANERTYNLKKSASDILGEMGIFAWVHKEQDNFFWVSTRKTWVERAKASTNPKKSVSRCFPRDIQHAEDSVCFNMKTDYTRAVQVLSLINKTH